LRDLKIWMRYMRDEADKDVMIYQGLFRKMEETPVSKDLAYQLFSSVYPHANELPAYFPPELRKREEGKNAEFDKKQDETRDAVMTLFGGAGIEITPTYWGAFNAITEYENHVRGSKKDTGESILIGNRYQTMQYALNTLTYSMENK